MRRAYADPADDVLREVQPQPAVSRRQARIAQRAPAARQVPVPPRHIPGYAPAPRKPAPRKQRTSASLWDAGSSGKVIAALVAVTELAVLGRVIHQKPVTVCDELLCNDAGHPNSQAVEPKKVLPDRHRADRRQQRPNLIVNGVRIPPLQNLTHEQSVKATTALAARGVNWRNRAIAMRYLMDEAGLADFKAAALIGGFQVETGYPSLPPGRHQEGGPAIGIAQWEGERQDALLAYAREKRQPWDSLMLQLAFICYELRGSEHAAGEWLRGTVGLPGAASAALNGFERPAARIVRLRLQYAANLLEAYYEEAPSR